MKIGIDGSLLLREMTGIGRYLRNTLEQIPKIDKKNEYFIFLPGEAPEYKKMGYKIISGPKVNFLPQKIYFPFWLLGPLNLLLRKNRMHIFWQPNHFLSPFFNYKKAKFIISVHDLIPKIREEFRNSFFRGYLSLLLPLSVKKSVKIITVSENSKKDIINFFNIPEEKIEVIYEAAEEKFKARHLSYYEKNKLQKKYNLPEEFILYISGIEKRKNIFGIIKIADILKQKKIKAPIILFGKKGFGSKEILKEIQKRKNISYKGFLEEEDLPKIYNLAKIFLFPSFYEGFGLPVLEAMQSGLPVLASNSSSLPEVIGSGGIMYYPNDYISFANEIEKILKNRIYAQRMSRKSLAQAKNFNWEKSVRKLIECFNSV